LAVPAHPTGQSGAPPLAAGVQEAVSDTGDGLLPARPPEPHSHNPLVRYFRVLGPGLVTGASDDDPSGITTYSVAGASLGYGMLWTAVATFPLMAAVQLVCARIGLGVRHCPDAPS